MLGNIQVMVSIFGIHARLLTEVHHNVSIVPSLQPLAGLTGE